MELNSVLMAGKSLMELGKELSKIIEKANESPDVTKRVLIYLAAVKNSVELLGKERQNILSDVRKCDLANEEQVNALWDRFDRFLFEDNIRPKLFSAVEGLKACKSEIENKSKAWWWRNKNKEEAVKSFIRLLDELELLIDRLTSDFFPGGSGAGIVTLFPIYELTQIAIRDSSHEEWLRVNGKVESLTTELQLAFSIKVIQNKS